MSFRKSMVVAVLSLMLVAPASALGLPSSRGIALQVNSYQPVGTDFLVSGEVQLLYGNAGRRALPSQDVQVFLDGEKVFAGKTDLAGRFSAYLKVAAVGRHVVEAVAPDNGLGEARESRTFDAYGPPPAPAALTATWAGGLRVNLTWTAPSGPGVGPVNDYLILRDGVVVGTSGSTSYADWTPRDGTFTYLVRARNLAGMSPDSEVATVSFTLPPPSAPQAFTAVERRGTGIMDLTWTAPASDGGATISNYRIERSVDGGAWAPLATLTSYARSYADSPPLSAVSVDYRVSASHVVNASNFGPAATASVIPSGDVLAISILGFRVCNSYASCQYVSPGQTYYRSGSGGVWVDIDFRGSVQVGRVAPPAATRVNTTHEGTYPGGCGRGCTNFGWAAVGVYTDASGAYGGRVGPHVVENPESACRMATVVSSASYSGMSARTTENFYICG